jgi:asparagine synthase (glutamine-hydrolysing)
MQVHKAANLLGARSPQELYFQLTSHWQQPLDVVQADREPTTMLSDTAAWPDLGSFSGQMMFLDLMTYLPDDILVKLDRASMAVSLEARVPLLDPRVIEFAWGIPLERKIRGGRGKWILREVLRRYLPDELIDRPKAGFSVPLGTWLRGALRDWAEDLLSESRLREGGYFEARPIRALWAAHLEGRVEAGYPLWDVLMFQAWLAEQR